jgi:hypothetical protein
MMRISRLLAPVLIGTFAISAVAATNLSGTWRGNMESGGVAPFHFTITDNKVEGTMRGADDKDHPISQGKLVGDKISLSVDTEWQGMPVKLLVNGTVSSDDEMKLHIASDNGYWSTDTVVKKEAK